MLKASETLKPQEVSHERSHSMQAVFASFDTLLLSHLKYFQRSSERKSDHQEGIDVHSGQALQFQTEHHHVSRNVTQTLRAPSLLPRLLPLPEDVKESFHKLILTRSYLNFHFASALANKEMLAFLRTLSLFLRN